MRAKADPIERFWAAVDRRNPDDCWLFKLKSKNPGGYGTIWFDMGDGRSKMHIAHRVAYFLEKGPLIPGLDVMHSCDVRLCCNPGHLSLGTRQDNVDDMMRKGRYRLGRRANKKTTSEHACAE